MIPYNPNRLLVPLPDDFAARLAQQPRHAIGNADPGMVAQPYADPGYNMPNVDIGNLNQAPGQEVSGTLPASYQQPQANGWQFDPAEAEAALKTLRRT